MKAPKKLLRREAGIALLTTILLMLLMSSLLIGFVLLITEGQKMSGLNNDYSRAFYASEAGMEKITADLGTLFNKNYSPTAAQLAAIASQPPQLYGITYSQYDGTSGYQMDYPGAPGAPQANVTTIKSGTSPYQGMTALATPYTLTVTARTQQGTEVKLQRTTQTVGIPMFQFGVFCDGDCSFFPGPNFNFGGRTHTNGNLFLASGSSLTLSDKVTVVKDVVRTNLSNGYPTTTGSYGGTINVTTGNGGFRALGYNEGSLVGTLGSAANTNWPAISQGYYNSNIVNGAKRLDLGIVTLGTGTKPIDIIRRPPPAEAAVVTQQRYFAQASVHILLSDKPQDIMNMPCIDITTQPFDLSKLARAAAVLQNPATGAADPQIAYLQGKLGANFVPLATSGSVGAYAPASPAVPPGNGYWIAPGQPIIPGYLKIEIQSGPSMQLTPCGNWQDVTLAVLGLGYVGRNINPVAGVADTALPVLPVGQLPAQAAVGCPEPFPNAIIRLERIRDNPLPVAGNPNPCGVDALGNIVNQKTIDFWPNTLFDTREGAFRDTSPGGSIGAPAINYNQMVTPGGVMHYLEVDAGNIAKWLAAGGAGHASFDPITAPNDYTVYVSDRRGNWVNGALLPGPWPPLSFSLNETGEYGFTDFINSLNASPCPNKGVETAEDLDGNGVLFTYGQDPGHSLQVSAPTVAQIPYSLVPAVWNGGYTPLAGVANPGTVTSGAGANAFAPYPGCNITNNLSGSPLWPGNYIIHANEARENPTFFFRRAVKIVNGNVLQTGPCPGTAGGTVINCGLTFASENPVYLQGDFNANSAGNNWSDPHVATSIVADAVTLLSNNWNDVNSFSSPFSTANRNANDTWYRVAIVAGKGISFAQPSYGGQDFGTDGGVHNFLRYIEDWGGQNLHYKGSMISLYVNHQAVGIFKCCSTVYSPPTRDYTFDIEFLQPQLLPPRTPLFRDVNTTGFTQLLLPQQ